MIKISANPLKQLEQNFEMLEKLFFEFRFLLRDAMVLMATNQNFKELFMINQQKRIKQIQETLEFFLKEDILIDSIKENIEKRAKLNWFITTYWQTFASTEGEVTKESIKEAKEIFFEFMIYPYLTDKGREMNKNIS